MDMHDVFSDLVAKSEDLFDMKVHRGMLLCAQKKYESLATNFSKAVQVISHSLPAEFSLDNTFRNTLSVVSL
jgi:hypothetical protein